MRAIDAGVNQMSKLIVYRVRLGKRGYPPAEEINRCIETGGKSPGPDYAFGADFSESTVVVVVVALACETYVVPNTRSQNGLVTPAGSDLVSWTWSEERCRDLAVDCMRTETQIRLLVCRGKM